MNQRTSYLDLSVTYGSTQKKVDELIDMKTGIIIIIIIIIMLKVIIIIIIIKVIIMIIIIIKTVFSKPMSQRYTFVNNYINSPLISE